ncbi:Uncharacterised protein [Bordetella pertussis]|nr:Uncharacterised protein [Bordetella pertussis]CFL89858.1 Uncharacterised protein [Bordetella pertussis]CFM12288.1 Uncharacterised protein [Bordetella pertussis]CFM41836.1 Uncharacterised protein [Bordetella pertussis]CFN52834.1 Uncharacterised protein [Bordetella pertussis]
MTTGATMMMTGMASMKVPSSSSTTVSTSSTAILLSVQSTSRPDRACGTCSATSTQANRPEAPISSRMDALPSPVDFRLSHRDFRLSVRYQKKPTSSA